MSNKIDKATFRKWLQLTGFELTNDEKSARKSFYGTARTINVPINLDNIIDVDDYWMSFCANYVKALREKISGTLILEVEDLPFYPLISTNSTAIDTAEYLIETNHALMDILLFEGAGDGKAWENLFRYILNTTEKACLIEDVDQRIEYLKNIRMDHIKDVEREDVDLPYFCRLKFPEDAYEKMEQLYHGNNEKLTEAEQMHEMEVLGF